MEHNYVALRKENFSLLDNIKESQFSVTLLH